MHPVEEKILRSLDSYEKRAKIEREKEKVENNDNRHFLLSLLESLSLLKRNLNTCCRIEISQCINKYETMRQKQQTTITNPPTTLSYAAYHQYYPHQIQQSAYQTQPHLQTYAENQQHYKPRTINPVLSSSQI